jgi:hypothetical protein
MGDDLGGMARHEVGADLDAALRGPLGVAEHASEETVLPRLASSTSPSDGAYAGTLPSTASAVSRPPSALDNETAQSSRCRSPPTRRRGRAGSPCSRASRPPATTSLAPAQDSEKASIPATSNFGDWE